MAEKKMRQVVELTGEKAYREALKNIEAGLKGVSASQANLNSRYEDGDKSLAKLSEQQELVRRRLELQKQKLDAVRKEHARVAAAEGENSDKAQKLTRDYQYAEAQCNRTARELAKLDETMKKAADGCQALRTKLKDAGGAMESIGQKAQGLGSKLTMALTTTISGAAVACGKAFMDFEDSMASVATIADTTTISMEALSEQALKTSSATGMAAKGIAEGAYSAISSGIETAKVMSYMQNAAKAAKAGQSDVSTVVDGSTSIMNAWKISAENATAVFEKMIVAQDLGKTTLGEISSQIGQLTGIAPQLNVSLEETLAATAALTKNGVQTSSAINGIKNVMAGVLKPTAEATETAKELGLQFNAAALKAKGLTGFLADVQAKTGGSEEALAKLFGSVEGLSQVLLLGGAAAGDYAMTLDAMATSAGALDRAFETRTASRAEQMSKALNELNNQSIRLGQSLAPMVNMASGALTNLAEVMERMTPAQQQTLITIAGVMAAAGPVTSYVGKITEGAGKLVKRLSDVRNIMKTMSTAGWIGVALAAVTAIVAGVVALKNHLDSISRSTKLKNAFDGVKLNLEKDGVNGFVNGVQGQLNDAELKARVKLQLENEMGAQSQEHIDVLSDGKMETPEEIKKIYDDVTGWVDDTVADAEAYIAETVAGLRASIASIEVLTPSDKIKIIGHALEDRETLKLAIMAYGVPESVAETASKQITASVDTLTSALNGIEGLTAADVKAVLARVLTGGELLADVLKEYGVDASIADGVATGIGASVETIKGALNGIEGLTDADVRSVIETALSGDGAGVQTALVGYGVDAAEASTAAATITTAVGYVKSALDGIEGLTDADIKALIANALTGKGMDIQTALTGYGVDPEAASTASATITAASATLKGAIGSISELTSQEKKDIIAAALAGGPTVQEALSSYHVADAAQIGGAIDAAIQTVIEAVNGLSELTTQEKKNVIAAALTGGTDLVAALMAYGVDQATATAMVNGLNDTIADISGAIEAVNKMPGISEETQTAVADALSAKMQSAVEELNQYKADYLAIIDAIYAEGRKPTEEEIERMDELVKKIAGVRADLAVLGSETAAYGEALSEAVKSGTGTSEMLGRATAYEQSAQSERETQISTDYQRQIAEAQQGLAGLQAALADGENVQAEIDSQTLYISGLFERQRAELAASRDGYAQTISDLFDGAAKAIPGASEKIEQALKDYDVMKAYDEYLSAEGSEGMQAWRDKWQAKLGLEDTKALNTDIQAMYRQAVDSLTEITASDELSKLWSDFYGALSTGMLDNVEANDLSGALKSMFELTSLHDDGVKIGDMVVEGITDAMEDRRVDAENGIGKVSQSVIDRAKAIFGIASPSKVFREIGMNLMLGANQGVRDGVRILKNTLLAAGRDSVQGLIDGANQRRATLIKAYQSIAEAAIQAARARLQIASPSKVFEDIGMNTGDGMIRGIMARTSAVKRAMRAMTSPDGATNSQRAENAPGTQNAAGTTMDIKMYYTGAVTMRDSRKAAQQLGKYLNGELLARGR